MIGKMKGQVFVTFPNAEMAKRALLEVHGYLLHGKPMIIVIFVCNIKLTVRRSLEEKVKMVQ
jgi:RNA recognition motif-containing protein